MEILVGILCLAALIVLHEAGHFVAARLFGMRVTRFSIGFFKPLVEWQPRGSETTYSIGALPLGGFVQIDGLSPVDEVDPEDRRSYANQPFYAKLCMIIAGPLANFLTAVVVFAVLFAVGGKPVAIDEPVIGVVMDGAAHDAGLQPSDKIISIDGQNVATWEEMREQFQKNRGKTVSVEYQRENESSEIAITPDADGVIGIYQATQMSEPLGPVEALYEGLVVSAVMTATLAVILWRIVTRQRSTAGVSGPVGIVDDLVKATNAGWMALMDLFARLSISLCLFNFLPIPALDGGRITFLAIEIVTRRRVNRTIEGYVQTVGFFLVLGLIILVTIRDVLHL